MAEEQSPGAAHEDKTPEARQDNAAGDQQLSHPVHFEPGSALANLASAVADSDEEEEVPFDEQEIEARMAFDGVAKDATSPLLTALKSSGVENYSLTQIGIKGDAEIVATYDHGNGIIVVEGRSGKGQNAFKAVYGISPDAYIAENPNQLTPDDFLNALKRDTPQLMAVAAQQGGGESFGIFLTENGHVVSGVQQEAWSLPDRVQARKPIHVPNSPANIRQALNPQDLSTMQSRLEQTAVRATTEIARGVGGN